MPKNKLESLESSKTFTEKLYDVFLRRYRRFWDDAGSGMREHDIVELWEEWLEERKGVEHVRKFSNLASPVDYLLERVNEPGWNRVVIHDPSDSKNFILVDRDFAEKVLVLDEVP